MMLRNAVSLLRKGFSAGGLTVKACKVTEGRFSEEKNVEITVSRKGSADHLMIAKVFFGRPPEYLPWVELFAINPRPSPGGRRLSYFDSALEERMLSLFADSMKSGVLFVEYNDDVTKEELCSSVPPAATRLGSKMFKLGFHWFKDWYYPEGFMEGGMKLQGEKTADKDASLRQLADIYHGLDSFLSREKRPRARIRPAVRRARELMREIERNKKLPASMFKHGLKEEGDGS